MPRTRHTINEQWRYTSGPVPGAERPDFDDREWQRVNLPHTWNANDAFDKTIVYRRGIGWYRKQLTLDAGLQGRRLFLYFEGANQVADVFVNGRHAGQHIGGYTAFVIDITTTVSFDVSNLIAVRVDNSHHPDIPPLNADFTFYGGIYRDVWLLATGPIHFNVTDHASPGVFVTTPGVSEKQAGLRVRGTVTNTSGRPARLRVVNRVLDANGHRIAEATWPLTVGAGATASFDRQMPPIESPHLWSPGDPYLYRLQTELHDGSRLIDRVESPIGFRWFSIDAQQGLTLNGKLLKLIGTNRHQDHPGYGNAMPDELHRRDVRLIKENGFNFLRLAHYPQDPAVLEEADRLGLIVWEEIPVVNLIGTSAAFAENSERMLVEMIRQHHNHPSIFFWGYMNEVLLTKPNPIPERYYQIVPQLVQRLENRVRAEDRTRATVMALSRDEVHDDYGISEIPDILGLNLYFGWYYEQIHTLGEFLDELHRKKPHRPLIVSEYGADSDERVHTMNPKAFDFSSEYPQLFHVESFPQLETRPFILGTAVWNQFDFGSAGRQDTKFGLNQKGLFFYDRTPKDTMYYYQAALLDTPVLHIASEWNRRAGSRPEDRKQPIWVYTNLPDVTLFVNSRSAGEKKVENRTARWSVELADGVNTIVALGKSGERGVRATTRVSYADRVGQFTKEATTGLIVAVNAGAHYAHVDEADVYWEADREYRPGSWGYVGGSGARTHHRIFATTDDPLFQASREGMSSYRFDVADGTYEVTLGFAEGKRDAVAGERLFSVHINGQEVIRGLDLVAAYGRYTAVTRSVVVEAAGDKGITIDFPAAKGRASVASIKVRNR